MIDNKPKNESTEMVDIISVGDNDYLNIDTDLDMNR